MKKILGRKDFWDFPILKCDKVPVKIDTGAYSCSIHCTDFVEENGFLKYTLSDHKNYKFGNKTFKTLDYTKKIITSSNGDSETRFAIKTDVEFLNDRFETIFTLSDRSEMDFPCLIGRLALKDYLIDPTKKWLNYKT